MAPMHKRSRHDVEEDIIVERASSSLRQDSHKKVRLSINSNSAYKTKNTRQRSPSTSSSSSDDEDEAMPDAGADAPMPSTQYEIDRDAGWKHLEHAAEDDRRATQALMKRAKRLGDNRPSDNSIVEEITCVNFMCHERLHVELGPLINFVVGHNGSGKSAVLTAITLCLGGKVSSTNRGASMKSLIKTGADQAVLIIRMKNEGRDAYQPDVYGRSFIIERHFTRGGTSGYKLKSDSGRTISTKRGDIDDIIEYYQLQVDNPMTVLNQDAAKAFIQTSTPAQKYKFFVEGVQLEALDNDYRLLSDICDQINEKLQDTAGDLETLKDNWKKARERAKTAREHDGLRMKARHVRMEFAWAQVEDRERDLAAKETDLKAAQDNVLAQEKKAAEKGEAFDHAEQQLERWQEQETQIQEELQPINKEEETARGAHDVAKKEVEKIRAERNEIKLNVRDAGKKIKGYEADITAEIKLLQAASGGAQARKIAEMENAKITVTEAKDALNQHGEASPRLEEDRKKAVAEMMRKESLLQSKQNDIKSVQGRIEGLRRNRGDPMAGHDPRMPQLLRMINSNAHKFHEKPVGPLGIHIKLLKPVWSLTIEAVLGGVLSSFIVTSPSDQRTLAAMVRSIGIKSGISIMIGNHHPITPQEPEEHFDTILRVLEIDNELVKKQLIIGNAIEQMILIQNRQEAYNTMYKGPKPRNVKGCFATMSTDASIKYGWTGGRNQDVGPINLNKDRSARMRSDVDHQIAHQQSILTGMEPEKEAAQSHLKEAKLALKDCDQAIAQHRRNYQTLKITLQRAETRVETLDQEIEQSRPEDGRLEGLKTNLEEAKQDLRIAQEAYGNVTLEMERVNTTATDRKRELDAVKIRLLDQEQKLEKIRNKVRNGTQVRTIALREKNLNIEIIKDVEAAAARAEKKRDHYAAQLAEHVEGASKICPRIPVPENMTSNSLEAQYAALKKQISLSEKRQGATDDEVFAAEKQAEADLIAAKAQRLQHEDLAALLRRSYKKRMVMFRRFQRYISARSRMNFQYFLSSRAFRGKLMIDHKTKLLDIDVEPDETTKSSKGRKAKTLSGGEKSFSSICLLLALWEAMGAPMRCLDEYDVFMDDVNRDISTEMLISAARKATGRQFILITPKALGSGAANKAADVKIIKLKDPRRDGQRQIDEMMQAK